MARLNYQHLHYFWTVAREGSIVAASRELGVTSSTISVQLRLLEEQFNRKLFERAGRGLRLTETGVIAYRYADSIFSTGQELESFLVGQRTGTSLRLDIGVAHFLPKLVTWQLIEPATHLDEPCHMVCHERSPSELVSDLILHQLDVILSDVPLDGGQSVRLFNHLLGESTVSWFGGRELAARCSAGFPNCLDKIPVLLPKTGTEMRRSLDAWFSGVGVTPMVAAEFDDLALLKVAGEHGLGIFPVPDVVAEEAVGHYNAKRVGPAEGVVERFYAVTAERQFAHPAVMAIASGARAFLGYEEPKN